MKALTLTIIGIVIGWLFREAAHDLDHTIFRFEVVDDKPGTFTKWILNLQ